MDVYDDIKAERERQKKLGFVTGSKPFDADNTKNDWVAFVSAYAGRAADKCNRNEREGNTFRSCMVKVAALAVAAIESHDAGFC